MRYWEFKNRSAELKLLKSSKTSLRKVFDLVTHEAHEVIQKVVVVTIDAKQKNKSHS